MDARDREIVAEAVRLAETGTAGEIVVVVDRAAASYRAVPAILALVAALLAPWPLLWLTMTSAPRIFLLQLVLAVVLLAALSWLGRGGKFVPRFVKRGQAHTMALREFTAQALSRTKGRTGVLVYVALQERYAEIVVDSGLEGLVDPAVWQGVVERLILAAREDRLREGLVEAVREIGAVLATKAPARPGDADELPNRVVVL